MRRKKYWLVSIAGVAAAILTYWLTQVLDSLLAQADLFNAWASIKSPPSGAARILGASDGAFQQYDEVWIETHDGQTLSASVCTGYSQPCGDLPQWKSISQTPVYSLDYTQGANCKKLGEFPLNPSGPIVECRYYVFWENDMETIIYYALMADGSLKYFVMDFAAQLTAQLKFLLANVLLYLVMFFLVFRVTNMLLNKFKREDNVTRQVSG